MSFWIIILFTLTAILWVWALVDIISSRFEDAATTLLWLVVIFLFPIMGSLVYFQFGKNSSAKTRRFNPTISK